MTRRATTLLAACALIAAGVAVYSDSFSGAFVFDDESIKNNPAIRSLWPLGPVLAGPRPVVELTFAINYALGGLHVTGYHVVNLAVHILAALVLFGIVRRTLLQCRLPNAECRMIKEKGESTANGARQETFAVHNAVIPNQSAIGNRQSAIASALALATALIWEVHPLQTESVTYIVQRAESLMGLLYLLTLYCVIRGFSSPNHRRTWHAAAVAACALGMGVKPVMVSAPLVVLAYDRLFVAPSVKAALRRSWRLYLGLAATWLILAFLLTRNATVIPTAGFEMESLTPWQYARTQFGVIVHYLALSFWPWPLCLDYGWPVASSLSAILPPALLVLALVGATIAGLRRASPLAFPGVWFFLILAPTSSIMPILDLCFEHRMYLPLAAVIALVVAGTYALGRRALEIVVPADSRRRLGTEVAAISCLLIAGFLGGLTFLRNQLYDDEATIWKDVTLHRPHNARAFFNLGCVLVTQNRNEEAIPYFLDAIRLTPRSAVAHDNLGIALSNLGRDDEAMRHFVAGAAVQPKSGDAHYNLAKALAARGKTDEAILEYEESLRLASGNGQAHNNLGRLLALKGRPAEALAHYREALRLLPDAPVVLMNLAWLRATCPDPKFRDAAEALRLARSQAGIGSPRALDVLAAACAEAGLFDEAVAAARQAIEAAERSGDKTAAAEIRDRLKLYEARKPCREQAAANAARTEP